MLTWWINLPKTIPHTDISLHGLVMLGLMLTVLIITGKKILKSNPTWSILSLTLFCTGVNFLDEVAFQAFRQSTYADYEPIERLTMFLSSLAGMTFVGFAISFFIAYQLK